MTEERETTIGVNEHRPGATAGSVEGNGNRKNQGLDSDALNPAVEFVAKKEGNGNRKSEGLEPEGLNAAVKSVAKKEGNGNRKSQGLETDVVNSAVKSVAKKEGNGNRKNQGLEPDAVNVAVKPEPNDEGGNRKRRRLEPDAPDVAVKPAPKDEDGNRKRRRLEPDAPDVEVKPAPKGEDRNHKRRALEPAIGAVKSVSKTDVDGNRQSRGLEPDPLSVLQDGGKGKDKRLSSSPPEIFSVAIQNVSDEISGEQIGSYTSLSLSMVKMPSCLKTVAFCSIVLFVAIISCLIFVPWQQSVSGRGKVVIFSPMERPQHLEAPIPGRILRWFVRDGQTVKEGEAIVELSEVDPRFLAPNQVAQMRKQKEALEAKRDASKARVESLKSQLASYGRVRIAAVAGAERRQSQTRDKLVAAQQSVDAAKQNLETAQLNFDRRKALYDKGLRSKRDYELSELDLVRAKTDLQTAQANLVVAQKETSVADIEISRVDADAAAGLDSTEASYNAARETVAATESEIQQLEIEMSHLQNRCHQRVLKSPCAGKLVRLLVAGAGETVTAGTQMAVIAPETNDLAVELKIQGNDAPLVSVGRPVRLQFAGWPALQFSGWPSVAVGTFAGRVAVVDAVDDGSGKFRIIVVPDEEAVEFKRDEPWPSTRFLRPGSEVHGWVMLNNVSLGFELWRQFNAFPPTIDTSELKSDGEIKRIKAK